jgi:hypothetical protein
VYLQINYAAGAFVHLCTAVSRGDLDWTPASKVPPELLARLPRLNDAEEAAGNTVLCIVVPQRVLVNSKQHRAAGTSPLLAFFNAIDVPDDDGIRDFHPRCPLLHHQAHWSGAQF